MNLNEQQKRIWETMIKVTNDYLENKVEFRYLVKSLEGVLDACELKDNNLIKKWYDFWTPLEIINAETEHIVSKEEKKRVVQQMRDFLKSV